MNIVIRASALPQDVQLRSVPPQGYLEGRVIPVSICCRYLKFELVRFPCSTSVFTPARIVHLVEWLPYTITLTRLKSFGSNSALLPLSMSPLRKSGEQRRRYATPQSQYTEKSASQSFHLGCNMLVELGELLDERSEIAVYLGLTGFILRKNSASSISTLFFSKSYVLRSVTNQPRPTARHNMQA